VIIENDTVQRLNKVNVLIIIKHTSSFQEFFYLCDIQNVQTSVVYKIHPDTKLRLSFISYNNLLISNTKDDD